MLRADLSLDSNMPIGPGSPRSRARLVFCLVRRLLSSAKVSHKD